MAKVLKINKLDFKCKFLRNYKGQKDFYVFLIIDDISSVKLSQILRMLKPMKIVRDRYTYSSSDSQCFENERKLVFDENRNFPIFLWRFFMDEYV